MNRIKFASSPLRWLGFCSIVAVSMITGTSIAFLYGFQIADGQQIDSVNGQFENLTPLVGEKRLSLASNSIQATHNESKSPGKILADTNLGGPANLPLPSTLPVSDYEAELFAFLKDRQYVDLGWKKDKSVRDTGPFIDGSYYGTHPAVRVFYSPGIIKWLEEGRVGTIPDGEFMIKEQYPPPAIRHQGKSEKELRESLESWTVMVKDSKGSHDGWFWSNPSADPKVVDNQKYPFDYPISGFGQYCVRCHASTQSPGVEVSDSRNEFTFAALRNVEGFPGEPIIFRVDDSWRDSAEADANENDEESDSENKNDQVGTGSETETETEISNSKPARFHTYGGSSHPACTNPDRPELCISEPNNAFMQYFDSIAQSKRESIEKIPPITHDWVVQNAERSRDFITSNQCMSCHAGLTKPYGPSMFVPLGESAEYGEPGWHISPYGEWRWTPMGLAGRDPIFFAQLESELARLKKEFDADQCEQISDALIDTCMRCHGAMGKHQFDADHQMVNASHSLNRQSKVPNIDSSSEGGHQPQFSLEHALATKDSGDKSSSHSHYGALARDGVSCMVCHRMQPRQQPEDDDRPYLKFFLETSITGNAHFGDNNEIYGPFKDNEIKPYAMQHATGFKPKHSDYLKSSQLCGTCHTVSLPAVDKPLSNDAPHTKVDVESFEEDAELIAGENVELFKKFEHHVEQATYLEWLNSEFENEFNPANPKAQSCQQCHMSSGLSDPENGIDLETISTRMAAIQDSTYPDAENLTKLDNLNIAVREEGYRRHNFSGLNVFLVEMFNQHDDILGVRKFDFMTGSKLDIEHAIQNFVQTARQKTADVSIQTSLDPDSSQSQVLTADVMVKNKAGHRFPSGVGFRRAFLELTVTQQRDDGTSKVVWASGRTNELGVLIGKDDQPLPAEMFKVDAEGKQAFHPHHQTITSQDQVQVYETLLQDASGKFTTSFIHGCARVKDNRFLPRGWTKEGPDPAALSGRYLKATHPGPVAIDDPEYTDGTGTDRVTYRIELPGNIDPKQLRVEAKLYYQAIPPYFLNHLFQSDPAGPAIKRLHFLCSNLDLSKTEIKDWKLLIQSAVSDVETSVR